MDKRIEEHIAAAERPNFLWYTLVTAERYAVDENEAKAYETIRKGMEKAYDMKCAGDEKALWGGDDK